MKSKHYFVISQLSKEATWELGLCPSGVSKLLCNFEQSHSPERQGKGRGEEENLDFGAEGFLAACASQPS